MSSFILNALDKLKDVTKSKGSELNDEAIEFLSFELPKILHKAILSGELYSEGAIYNIENLKSEIFALNEFIPAKKDSSKTEWLEKENDTTELVEIIKIVQSGYLTNLLSLAITINTSLHNFLERKEGLIIDTRKFQSYSLLKEISLIINNNPKDQTKANDYSIFLVNILLAYIDIYLECNDEILSVLDNVILFLKDNDNALLGLDILKKLKDKAEFLRYKIDYRNSRQTIEKDWFASPPLNLQEKNTFKEFEYKIVNHYKNSFAFPELKEKTERYIAEKINEISLEPFHHLNRYYNKHAERDLKYSIDGVRGLLEKLTTLSKNKNDLPLYDKIAFQSVFKLIQNTSLKLSLLEQKRNSFSDILLSFKEYITSNNKAELSALKEIQKQIDQINEERDLPDYYCYILFIKFLNSLIEELIQHPSCLITSDFLDLPKDLEIKIEALIEKIKNIYDEEMQNLKTNLRQIATHKVRPVTLLLKESRIKCTWSDDSIFEEGELFLNSSYILPINFERLNQKILTWGSLLSPQLSHLKDAFNIELSRLTLKANAETLGNKIEHSQIQFAELVKESTNNFQAEAKRNEFRVVQTIAMFVSIATFVLLNVKIFDNKTGIQSFAIIMGLASCFFCFNLFFHLIILNQHLEKTLYDKKLFVTKILGFITVPIVLAWISFKILANDPYGNVDEMQHIKFRMKADSLKLIYDSTFIDSIRKDTNKKTLKTSRKT